MLTPSVQENRDPFMAELIEFSSQAAVKKMARSRRTHSLELKTVAQRKVQEPRLQVSAKSHLEVGHAAPLMPLRERDMKSLAELFEHEQIHEIEADVIRNLLVRWPEPCWEDEPFEFLQDYL